MPAATQPRAPRARDLGVVIGEGRPGRWNAITDVAGVRVGHATIIEGDGPLVAGRGPVRTGVTVVVPHEGDVWAEPLFAGTHTLNGNGEMTGLEWVRESGYLHGVVGITNTHAVGTVRDALYGIAAGVHRPGDDYWALPVVGETFDGRLNDIAGDHVRAEHVATAVAAARNGPVDEGNIGGGTGMICHEFKGGIGTASRVLPADLGGFTVGVLVQANYGRRGLLRIDGVPVGEAIPITEVPSPRSEPSRGIRELPGPEPRPGAGSIIVIVATDAPALPHQCRRIAQRAGIGIGRVGGYGAPSSGDIFLAFSTANRGMSAAETLPPEGRVLRVEALADAALEPVFEATVEATEEAIVNALVAAETMTGRDGVTAHRLPHVRLRDVMAAAGRLHEPESRA